MDRPAYADPSKQMLVDELFVIVWLAVAGRVSAV